MHFCLAGECIEKWNEAAGVGIAIGMYIARRNANAGFIAPLSYSSQAQSGYALKSRYAPRKKHTAVSPREYLESLVATLERFSARFT